MTYEKKKRNKIDRCNICGVVTNLTWDHVPPKLCYNSTNTKINYFFNGLPKADKYAWQYQNGVRFRSICEKCNNGLLGGVYDVELNKFIHEIKEIITSDITLPSIIELKNVNINKIVRAVCGHILAAKNYFDDSSLIDKSLRKFVINQDTTPPDNLHLLYWVYPYRTMLILRDIVVKSNCTNIKFPNGVISVISAFPISYILTTETEKCGLGDLFSYCSRNIENTVNFPLNLLSCMYSGTRIFRNYLWPCNITDDFDGASILLGSNTNQNIIATRKIDIK